MKISWPWPFPQVSSSYHYFNNQIIRRVVYICSSISSLALYSDFFLRSIRPLTCQIHLHSLKLSQYLTLGMTLYLLKPSLHLALWPCNYSVFPKYVLAMCSPCSSFSCFTTPGAPPWFYPWSSWHRLILPLIVQCFGALLRSHLDHHQFESSVSSHSTPMSLPVRQHYPQYLGLLKGINHLLLILVLQYPVFTIQGQ